MFWFILGGLALLIGSFGVGVVIAIAIDELIKRFSGKKIAIIGERCTGKTKMWDFLSSGTISSQYIQTQTPERVNIKAFPLKDLNLKLKEIQTDVPGGWDFLESWINLAKESDYVFYLFRLPCFYHSKDCKSICPFKNLVHCGGKMDYLKKFELAINKINNEKLADRTILVGTFSDYVDDYVKLEKEGKGGNFYERFIRSIDNYRMINILKEFKIVLGSLKDSESTQKLVVSIFKRAMEDK